ncbi:MAG TPA: GIY-YIG nuclease family protein [Paludibacter sp.]|nr:GIY-YIG nuclease family protein [Paludibacter sp.]
MFTVYVLHSRDFDKTYTGFTNNLENRLAAHNHPQNKGWTRSFQPWRVIHTETFETKSLAMRREKQLKTARGREFIKTKIL